MSSLLIEKLTHHWGYATATQDNWLSLSRGTSVCLFFTGDPIKYPEANDVAVVLPELAAHFEGQFCPAVVARDDEMVLQKHFGFARWPALVFVRDGRALGSIEKIQDWSHYLELIPKFLEQSLGTEDEAESNGGIPLVTIPHG